MRAFWLLALGLGAFAAQSAAALTISDDAFLEGNWTTTEIADTGGNATFTTSQQLAGGDPGSFRQTTHSIPDAAQSIVLGHVFTGASFDPSASGPIESLEFGLDLRFVGGSVGTSQVGHQLLLSQAGSLYNALATAGAVAQGPGNGLPGPWSSHSFSGLSASSFTLLSGNGPATPDFSRAGGPIQFGYLTLNTSIDTGLATTSGIDNWSVAILVPEPSTVALLAGALLALAARARRACLPPRGVEDSR
jgi:hypothetical protein